MALGDILGSVLRGVLSGRGGGQGGVQGFGQAVGGRMGGEADPIAAVIAALLTPQQGQAAQAFGQGGLAELVGQFRGAGHAEAVESWVGTGPNRAIEPSALEAVFGRERVGAMAQESGLPQNDLLSGLARMLPEVINGLTPQGQLPRQEAGMEQMLAGVLGQFLGGRR